MNYLAISGIIVFISSIACSAFVLISKPRTTLKLTWGLFSFTVSLWGLGLFKAYSTNNYNQALFWARFLNLSALTIPVFFVHFVFLFTEKFRSKKTELIIYYAFIVSILFLSLFSPKHFIPNLSPKSGFQFYPNPGILYYIFPLVFAYLSSYGIYLLFLESRVHNQVKSYQSKYILLGVVIGFLGGGTTFLEVFDLKIYPFGTSLVTVHVILTTYAIIRYRLMDIRLAITKVTIFFFVYAFILSVPLWIGYNLHHWEHSVWLMLLLATIGPYIYTYLRKQAEAKLFQKQLAYQQTLKQASYGIGRIKELGLLIKLMNRILLRSVGIERCAIYLIDQQEDDPIYNLKNKSDSLPPRITIAPEILDTLKKHSKPFITEEIVYNNQNDSRIKDMAEFLRTFKSEIVIPIVQSDKLLCLVLLGKKKDHTIYTNDDLTVFTILSSQAGLAIENCLFMEAERERLKQEGVRARRESLDMMVSTMAHEIDNPITAAIGKSVMIEEVLNFFRSCLPQETLDELKQHAKDMMFNCQRVSKIVKAVEDYSKRETGKFKKVYINVVMVPTRSLLTLKQKLYKDTKYTEKVEDNLPPFWGEDIMFEEIVMNLVENAFMAVKHNEGEKWVHLHIFKKDEDYLRIEVADNGYGIASKIKKQLFEVPTTTKGSSEGTGIGLYRVRQICELLKAKYGAESEGRDKGALFFVEMPIYKEDQHKKDSANGEEQH